MASSSRPFRSRLLRRLIALSRRLSEVCARSARQMRVTAQWSLQAVFYPVYVVLWQRPIYTPLAGVWRGLRQRLQLGASAQPSPQGPDISLETTRAMVVNRRWWHRLIPRLSSPVSPLPPESLSRPQIKAERTARPITLKERLQHWLVSLWSPRSICKPICKPSDAFQLDRRQRLPESGPGHLLPRGRVTQFGWARLIGQLGRWQPQGAIARTRPLSSDARSSPTLVKVSGPVRTIALDGPSSSAAIAVIARVMTARADGSSWIETPATTVGYVDHPLVKLLRWIDRGLLWLESWLQRLWHWWRGFIVGDAKGAGSSQLAVEKPETKPEPVEPRQ